MMSEKVPKFRMSRLKKNNMKTFPIMGCLLVLLLLESAVEQKLPLLVKFRALGE